MPFIQMNTAGDVIEWIPKWFYNNYLSKFSYIIDILNI
jgi:hypothetical protein